MKKYTKSGHLQGNTTVTTHVSPFIQGTVPVTSTGVISELASLSTPWTRSLSIETDQGTYLAAFNDTNTNGGSLSGIVSAINSDTVNNTIVVASAYGGVLKLQANSTGEGAYIRINNSNDTLAYTLGFTVYPHSTATVYSGDLLSAAVNAHYQGNPTGTAFLADGEDRSSEHYNRALAATLENVESNRSMLLNPLGYEVILKLPQNSPRYLKDSTGLVYGIDLATTIVDTFSSTLASRILVGTITKDSSIREIRQLYKVSDVDGTETTYVKSVLSGRPASVATNQTLVLTDTPNTSTPLASSWKDGGLAFSANASKTASTHNITSFIDGYTIECATASFITDGVASGDILVFTGSLNSPYSNNGNYYVENVVSETVIEVRPLEHSDIAPFATTSVAGAVQVFTGGIWAKDVSIIFSELVTDTDMLLSLPFEKITGDLPEDALLGKDIVEVSLALANVLGKTRTLNNAYNNTAADPDSAGGFAIDISNRPVHINGNQVSQGSIASTPVTIDVTVLSGNVLETSGAGIFTENQIGSVCTILSAQVTGIPGQSDIIRDEPLIIENFISDTQVKIQRVRNSQDLPVSSTVYTLNIYDKTPTVTLPGAMVSRLGNVGGTFAVMGGEQTATSPVPLEGSFGFATLNLVKQLSTATSSAFNSVAKVKLLTNASSMSIEGVNADYLNGLFLKESVRHSLVCHILNGPNSGFYLVNTIVGIPAASVLSEVSMLNMDGSPASFVVSASTQYVSLYYTLHSTAPVNGYNTSNTMFVVSYSEATAGIGLSIQGSGPSNVLFHLSNNEGTDLDDLQDGFASTGVNMMSIAGPGLDYNISLNTFGIAGWDYNSQNSNAPVTIGSNGLGPIGIYSYSRTYHSSPHNNPNYFDSISVSLERGGNVFKASGPDAALTATSNNPIILTNNYVSGASLVVANDTSYLGSVEPALALYGNVYAPKHDVYKSVWFTEASVTVSELMSADPTDVTDPALWDSTQVVGDHWVVGRLNTSSGNLAANMLAQDYAEFDVPHKFILSIGPGIFANPVSSTYPQIFSHDVSYVGSLLFIASKATSTTIKALENEFGAATFPFGLGNSKEFTGPAKGFKVIAQKKVGISTLLAVQATDNTGSVLAINGATGLSVVLVRKPFTGRVDVSSSVSVGRTSYVPRSYEFADETTSPLQHPVLFSRERDTTVSTTVFPKTVTKPGSLLFGSETYWTADPIVDMLTQYRKHGAKIENSVANTFRTSATAETSSSLSFFTKKTIVQSLYNNVTTSSPSFYVSDGGGYDLPSPYNQQGYQAFRGGGSKLALFSKFWDETLIGNTTHYVKYALGASVLTQHSTINVHIVAAHLDAVDKNLTIRLKSGSVILASRVVPMYANKQGSLLYRKYVSIDVAFSAYDLDAALLPTEKEDLYIELAISTKPGYVHHAALQNATLQDLEKIGQRIFYREDYFGSTNILARDFPDGVFIAELSADIVSKHAALTSGLDVEGTVNTRALRLSAAAKGYNTISPASVDLLQNSEYGSLHGNGILPDENLSAIPPFGEVTEGFSKEGTVEGNDVGLLPLWKAVFAGVSNLAVLEYINRADAKTSDATSINDIVINNPIRKLLDVDLESFDGTYPLGTAVSRYIVARANALTLLSDQVFNTSNNIVSSGLEKSSLIYNVNGTVFAYNNGDSPASEKNNIRFFGAHVFVTFYRPTYDRSAFFRKGVHSAAIHAYHPYYDPMFYWLNAAYGINKGRGLDHDTGDTNPAELGSFRLNKTRSYIQLLESKVNPDAVKLPGKTGFLIPLDPPHGSRLTKLDINISIRPMMSRKLNKTDNLPSDEYNYSYGIWNSTPTLDMDGSAWMERDAWNIREGYTVKIWRHSMFDFGNYSGDPGTDPFSSSALTVSNHSVKMVGGAECIYTKEVFLRLTAGDPSNYADSAANILKEAVSSFSETLSTESNMVANREVYSYFATVEFYTGVRKEKPFEDGAGVEVDCYTIPGLGYSHMDHYNSIHFPYMWNTMYSHKPPTEGISYGNGMAESSLWQGLWVPHGDPFRNKYYEQGIVRGHPLNRANTTSAAPIDPNYASSYPTVRADVTSSPSAFGDTNGNVPVDNVGYTLKLGKGLQAVRDLTTTVPNQELWYPVIKFRGARLTYLIDRPGHGGWGGDIS